MATRENGLAYVLHFQELEAYAELGRRIGTMIRKADAFADRDYSP